jgi:kynurenine formamidase
MRDDADLLDLTMRLSEATPVYPGDPAVRIDTTADFQDSGYFNTRLTLGSHNGTHLDAESHMIPGGRMLDAYPLDRFRGRGVVLDVRDGTAADLASTLQGADIDDDCVVLLWTGLSDAWREPDYYLRVPDLPVGLVELLIARSVKMVGVDAGSIDAEPFAVHKALLSHGILIAENLVGLSAISARQEPDFTVWALPLHLATEASPARVVAAW